MKTISVLGSTGSIGSQTLDVVSRFPKEFKVAGVAAYSNVDALTEQVKKFNVGAACVWKEEKKAELQEKVGPDVQVFAGMPGLKKIACLPEVDDVVVSVVGSVGLEPTLAAINAGKNLAVANKETLVVAGEIVMKAVQEKGVRLLPVDSEHCAIFQCLRGENRGELKRILLTCSGGPFKHAPKEEFAGVTVEKALGHPTWTMGPKITIDSSTLMNKGLEAIEAHWLFDVDYDDITVVVHPQSLIHSLVEFVDGSMIAQIGTHDMRTPIQFALSFPKRLPTNFPTLDLFEAKEMTFMPPDLEKFPCLAYAFEAGKTGGTMPAVLNAANEVVVNAFLKEQAKYLDIPRVVRSAMDAHKAVKKPSLEQVLEADAWARKHAEEELKSSTE